MNDNEVDGLQVQVTEECAQVWNRRDAGKWSVSVGDCDRLL